jgi:N-methylhydantoinase A
MRIATDTGGTFTDMVLRLDNGREHFFKAVTTPEDPSIGVMVALDNAAHTLHTSSRELLEHCQLFLHATTHALNAIVTETTARTGFITTAGHPDILLFREGGRFGINPFNFRLPNPRPYVPRSLTREVQERIGSKGEIVQPLQEDSVRRALEYFEQQSVEAIGVCLLWSMLNPQHELRVGELIEECLPNVAVSLSHQVNPSIREYRRASSTVIDASLKPLMTHYLKRLEMQLRASGFSGQLMMVTSQGGFMHARDVIAQPIFVVNSGPSLAPVAANSVLQRDQLPLSAIVVDTGGTTCDISVVLNGHISRSREAWVGVPFIGHMTGFPSVDVRSIGAGGGSLAWLDAGNMLRVGPASAGANPGPVCYGRGGEHPTLTDAAVVLGIIDAKRLLGGVVALNESAARQALARHIAEPLGLTIEHSALAIMEIATENMVQAIIDMTVKQGLDPAELSLIGAGGAAGFNLVRMARRLRCSRALLPYSGAVLCASGALAADLNREFLLPCHLLLEPAAVATLNAGLAALTERAQSFLTNSGVPQKNCTLNYFLEGRYHGQLWEIEIPLDAAILTAEHFPAIQTRFHQRHHQLFTFSEVGTDIEVLQLRVGASSNFWQKSTDNLARIRSTIPLAAQSYRQVVLGPADSRCVAVYEIDQLAIDTVITGPAIIETAYSSLLLDVDARLTVLASGSLEIELNGSP